MSKVEIKKTTEQKSNVEVRMMAVNFRAVEEESEKMIIEGYAVVFDSPATHFNLTEIIDKNAFNGCDMKDVPLKYNHDDSHLILARTRNDSLVLLIDDKVRSELIDTQSNIDIYKSIKAGLIDKMSFAFTVAEADWDVSVEPAIRTIKRIDKLYDVSVVDTPWYDATSIYARALSTLDSEKKKLDSFKEQKRQLERQKLATILKIYGGK